MAVREREIPAEMSSPETSPDFTLSVFLAPIFWAVKVETEFPTWTMGPMAMVSIFVAAVYPAITTEP